MLNASPAGCRVAPSLLDVMPRPLTDQQQHGSRKLMVMPLGTLPSRLAAIASAATLARRSDVDLTIVWPSGGDPEFEASWADLYQAPTLHIGPFPSGRYSFADAGCTVHRVSNFDEYVKVHNLWETVDENQVLCVVATGSFVRERHQANWFYRQLMPSRGVSRIIGALKRAYDWHFWGQFVGIHACRSQECIEKQDLGGDELLSRQHSRHHLPSTSEFLALANRFASMPLDGESMPRFFIVSEDRAEEEALRQQLWAMNLTGAEGTGVVLEGEARHRKPHSLAGLQEIAASLHLLSDASLLIGSPGSDFSNAAAATGDVFMVIAGEEGGWEGEGSGSDGF